MKKRRTISRIIVCGFLLLAFCTVASSCSLFDYGNKTEEAPLATPIKAAYTEYKVIEGDIKREFSGTCTVTSNSFVRHSFGVEGYPLEKYNVRAGDKVEVGDVLAVLKMDDVEAEIEQIQARLAAGGLNTNREKELKNQLETYNRTLEQKELKAKVAGTVRYVNSDYSNRKDNNKLVSWNVTMVVVDPEIVEEATGIMNVERSTVEKYGMGIGTKVTLSKTVSGKGKVVFEGEIVGSSLVDSSWYGMSSTVTLQIDLSGAAPGDIKVDDRLSVKYEDKEKEAIGVPKVQKQAIHTSNGRSYVFVLDNQGFRRECFVELGLEDDEPTGFVEIKAGLEVGDLYLLN